MGTNKKEGNDVKLAMLSFEDVIEAKIKNQSEKAEDSNNSTGSRGRRSALQGGKSTDSAKRWKSAGTRIKMTNMLSGKVKKAKSKKWWEQDEYLSWHVLKRKQCNHMSNTDQMEGGLLSIQLMMIAFGLCMLFIRRMPGNDADISFFNKFDTDDFNPFDILTVLLIVALCIPLYWSISITMKAMKAYGGENKQTKKTIEGNTCCGKW